MDTRPVLRVCADPNNLPFSNAQGEGFENHLAVMAAQALHRRLETVWWAQRRGFVRNTLNAGRCDVVMGVPAGYGLTRTTQPYYRSGFVLVSRAAAPVHIDSFDDPQLRRLRIGVHLLGPDDMPPPALALARHGITRNVVGYSIYGDYREPNPPLRMIAAVARGDIDAAIAWGPFAGFVAQREHAVPLVWQALPADGASGLPFSYAIAMGVRKDDVALQRTLDGFLATHAPQIRALLQAYGVPLFSTHGDAVAAR